LREDTDCFAACCAFTRLVRISKIDMKVLFNGGSECNLLWFLRHAVITLQCISVIFTCTSYAILLHSSFPVIRYFLIYMSKHTLTDDHDINIW